MARPRNAAANRLLDQATDSLRQAADYSAMAAALRAMDPRHLNPTIGEEVARLRRLEAEMLEDAADRRARAQHVASPSSRAGR